MLRPEDILQVNRSTLELCAYRLTSVGIGKEAGASLGFNRQMYQGLFMAPHVVSQALKAAVLCSAVFEKLGFEVDPKPNEIRHDIIQSIKFGDPDKLQHFVREYKRCTGGQLCYT